MEQELLHVIAYLMINHQLLIYSMTWTIPFSVTPFCQIIAHHLSLNLDEHASIHGIHAGRVCSIGTILLRVYTCFSVGLVIFASSSHAIT